ncbi:MAG: energy-coupling factor transporter transmembrane component T [Anaerolineales bacterium]
MNTIYYQGSSLLHRLNPLSKFLFSLVLFAFIMLTTDPWTPLAFTSFMLILLLWLGRLPVRRLAKVLWPILLIAGAFLVFYPLLVRHSLVASTPLLFEIGPLRNHQAGLEYGFTTALRILALLTISLLFSLTTDSADFIRALVQQWRLPYRIGYSTLAAFRFVPMLQTEMAVIRAAHRVRGINGAHGLRGAYERLRRYAVPLLATAIRQAERTALAMDGRAFGAFPQRTYYRRTRFMAVDWLFMLGMAVGSVLLLLVLQALGLLGPLAFLQIL